METLTFEASIETIDLMIAKQRTLWNLDKYPSISYEDISQMLRIHIEKKWHTFKQGMPLEPWVSKIIKHKIYNFLNHYYRRFAPPACYYECINKKRLCFKCEKWEQKKKRAYNFQFPESSSDETYKPSVEKVSTNGFEIDEEQVEALHRRMRETLPKRLVNPYVWIYEEGKTDEFVAEQLHFKTTENKRRPGYRQIQNIKNKIFKHAKDLVEKEDLIYG